MSGVASATGPRSLDEDLSPKLTPLQAHSDGFTRDLTRTWTRIKTGQ